MTEATELLKRARKILDNYWFSEDGEHNNNGVMELCDDIGDFFIRNKPEVLRCSFCGETDDDVKYMVKASKDDPYSVVICNECVADCVQAMLGRDSVEED